MINPGPLTFDAVIQSIDGLPDNAYLEFPYDLKETYGKGNLVPVKITFDDRVHYTGSLTKMNGPIPKILLRKDIRAQLGKGPGKTVTVRVELDNSLRTIELDADEVRTLKDAGLLDYFKGLAFSHQREYHQWVTEAKKPETRQKRLQKILEMLTQAQKEPR